VRASQSDSLGLATTSGLAFLAFLNATLLNAALPELAAALGDRGLEVVGWTVTAYAAALAAGLIAGGRLADAVGRRGLLGCGALLFALASVGCTLAGSADTLIAARAAQGAAAALITPASFGLLLEMTAEKRRPRAIGIWSGAAAASVFVGPPAGGALIDLLGWRAPFAIAAALALVLAVSTLWLAPSPNADREPPAVLGALVGAVAAATLVVTTAKAGEWGWADPRTVGGLGVGAVGVGAGLRARPRSRWRIVDQGLLGRPAFAAANVLSIVFGLAAFSWLLAAPLFVATVWSWDALAAAGSIAPGAAAAAFAARAAGRLAPPVRPWTIVFGGVALALAMALLIVELTRTPEFSEVWLPVGLVAGAAVGAALACLSAIVAGSVPSRDFAQAAGINMTARQLGGALGVAVVTALVGARGGSGPSDFDALWSVIGAAAVATAVGGAALARRERLSRRVPTAPRRVLAQRRYGKLGA
jgi:MFS family permease